MTYTRYNLDAISNSLYYPSIVRIYSLWKLFAKNSLMASEGKFIVMSPLLYYRSRAISAPVRREVLGAVLSARPHAYSSDRKHGAYRLSSPCDALCVYDFWQTCLSACPAIAWSIIHTAYNAVLELAAVSCSGVVGHLFEGRSCR